MEDPNALPINWTGSIWAIDSYPGNLLNRDNSGEEPVVTYGERLTRKELFQTAATETQPADMPVLDIEFTGTREPWQDIRTDDKLKVWLENQSPPHFRKDPKCRFV
jgi:hypothetical protein